MSSLDQMRAKAHLALLFVAGAGVALYAITALFVAPGKLVPGFVLLGGATAGAFFAWKTMPNTVAARCTMAAAMVAFPAGLTYLMGGMAWQLDMHMVFFASLAVVALLVDWRAILVAAAVTAVHHLSLNFIFPYAVFPDGANFFRVVFHAAVVIFQTAALLWLTAKTAEALENGDTSVKAAEAAQADAQAATEEVRQSQIADQNRREAIAGLAEKFELAMRDVVSGVAAASSQVNGLAASLGDDANATRAGAESAASKATETTANVESVASAAQEMAASIAEVSRILESNSEVSERAANEAEGAGESIGELETAAKEIEAIVQLVSDVAEQTNLLALNATIEAARAGEAGKGFAVVASEVKALAEQTAQASNDIAGRIDSMRGAAGGATRSLGRIAEIIEELRKATQGVTDAFTEQSSATNEIARLAEQAAHATGTVNAEMSDVTGAAERTTSAADEFARASEALKSSADSLEGELNTFREQLDAA